MSKKLILTASIATAIGCYAFSTPAFAQEQAPAQQKVSTVPSGLTTLSSVFQEVLNSNPEIAAAKHTALADKEGIKSARAAYLPQVDVNGGIGYARNKLNGADWTSGVSDQVGITATQLIFDGFGTPERIKFNKEKYAASQAKTDEQIENTALETTEVFLNVQRFKKLIALAGDNVQNHERTLNIIKNDKSGRYDPVDVNLANGRLAQARATLFSVQGEQKNANAAYQGVVGSYPAALSLHVGNMTKEIQRKYLPDSLTLNQALEIAQKNNPAKTADMKTVASTQHAIKAAQAAYFPTISGQLSAQSERNTGGLSERNTNLSALVIANFNLFRGFADQAAVAAATENNLTAQANLRSTERDVNETVKQAYDNLKTDQARLGELWNHFQESKKVVEVYTQQYKDDANKRIIINVLDVENEQFNAETAYYNGLYQVLNDQFALLASMGELSKVLPNLS